MTKGNPGRRWRRTRLRRTVLLVGSAVIFLVLIPALLLIEPKRRLQRPSTDTDGQLRTATNKNAVERSSGGGGRRPGYRDGERPPPFPGHATPDATRRFSVEAASGARLRPGVHSLSYRTFQPTGLVFSTIGVGTYLGDKTDATDALVIDAIVSSVNGGVNVIDSASNYRGGRGEFSVGVALERLLSDVDVHVPPGSARRRRRYDRSELFVSTKAGFVATHELKERAKALGATESDFGGGGRHCVAPACLEASLDSSLERMGIETVDLFYLHNVAEKRADELSDDGLQSLIFRAFTHLEEEKKRGRIRYYGLATFSKSFRSSPGQLGAIRLDAILALARRAAGCGENGGCDHGFRFVQLPVSPHAMPELYEEPWESERTQTLAEAAEVAGIGLFSSKSLGPPGADAGCLNFAALGSSIGSRQSSEDDAKALLLHATRSAPGLLSALVGHKVADHVRANLGILTSPPLAKEDFDAVVRNC